MSLHILTIFTTFDGGSLATPLSKDGFELTYCQEVVQVQVDFIFD